MVVAWWRWPAHLAMVPSVAMPLPRGAAVPDGAYATEVMSLEFGDRRRVQCTRRLGATFTQYQLRGYFWRLAGGNTRPIQSMFSPEEAQSATAEPAPRLLNEGASSRADPGAVEHLKWPGWAQQGLAAEGDLVAFEACASGWPLPCVSAYCRFPGSSVSLRGPCIVLRRTFPWSDGVLPVLPVWPGIVVNSLVFAMPWYGCYAAAASAKRAWRRRRGGCPECAYDIQGAFEGGCPECGWNRASDGAGPSAHHGVM